MNMMMLKLMLKITLKNADDVEDDAHHNLRSATQWFTSQMSARCFSVRGELAPDQASPNPIPSLHQPSQAPRSPQRPRSSQARRPPQATRSVHPARQTLPPGRAPPPPQRRVLLPTPVWVLPTSTSSLQMSTCHR